MPSVHFVFRRNGEQIARESAHLATQVIAWPGVNAPGAKRTKTLAAVEYSATDKKWRSQDMPDPRRWPDWRQAMRDLGVADFSELDFWYAVDNEPQRNGTPGGDYQVTDSWNVRLYNDALPGAVVDVDYYAERSHPQNSEIPADPPEYGVTGMLQYTLCTDRDDPGGTETWADIQYDNEADPLAYGDLHKADQAARFQASRWVRQAAMFMEWDGKPF